MGIYFNPQENLNFGTMQIGKVIEYILHNEYYLSGDRVLDYVGFIKMHPHDTDSIIRISFHQQENLI